MFCSWVLVSGRHEVNICVPLCASACMVRLNVTVTSFGRHAVMTPVMLTPYGRVNIAQAIKVSQDRNVHQDCCQQAASRHTVRDDKFRHALRCGGVHNQLVKGEHLRLWQRRVVAGSRLQNSNQIEACRLLSAIYLFAHS